MIAVELAEKYPNIFAVIGVHPTYAGEAPDDVMTPLRELAKNPRVVALGEMPNIVSYVVADIPGLIEGASEGG